MENRYTLVTEPNRAQASEVTERLRQFNLARSPGLRSDGEPEPLEIYALDEAGAVAAGLVGKTIWGWLEIGVIWVDADLRHQGIGSELMRRAEDEARRRGCKHARLSTFDFQAPEFYERLGYVSFGQLEGYPEGHTVHYFRKDLARHS